MINLILAIICSSGNSLIMKFHEKHSENRVALLLMNYVMAVIFGGALVVKEIARLDFHRMGMTPLLGMVNGFFYVSAFLLLQLSIRKNGATVSASLSHMGLLIPVLLSIVLFREYPGSTQWGGVILAVASLSVVSIPTGGFSVGKGSRAIGASSAEGTSYRWLLIPMLVCSGMADTMSKVFEAFCPHELEDFFISITFAMALVLCILAYFFSHEHMNRVDLMCGMLLGISNYLSTKFLIRAIYDIPAFISYIVFGLGVALFINCINWTVLQEELTRRDYIGMALSMGAIVLLNL